MKILGASYPTGRRYRWLEWASALLLFWSERQKSAALFAFFVGAIWPLGALGGNLLQPPISDSRITIYGDLPAILAHMRTIKDVIICGVPGDKYLSSILPDLREIIGRPSASAGTVHLFGPRERMSRSNVGDSGVLFARQSSDQIFRLSSPVVLEVWCEIPDISLWLNRMLGHLNFYQLDKSSFIGAKSLIGPFKRKILEVTDTHGSSGSRKDSDGSPYNRIAKGVFLLLCCCIFGEFGIIRIYNLSDGGNSQSYEDGKEKWRAAVTASALVIGWVAGVYGTILLLPALRDLTLVDRRSENYFLS